MSNEYKYSLCITGESADHVSKAIQALEAENIVPDMLHVDMPAYGQPAVAYLSTENQRPYGTISCWPAAEHEAYFHSLSLNNPGVLFELTGENIDDPNNGVFKKAFQDGRFREAYIEKQDIDSVLEETPWRMYGEPEKEGKEAEVLAMFNKMDAMQKSSYFQIASDMFFIRNVIEPNEPLSNEKAYQLACKLDEACGGFITIPALHEEFLDALRYLLENGIREGSYQEYPKRSPAVSPENTLRLLLKADLQVFGTLIETKTVDNQRRINDPDISFDKEDIHAVQKAVEQFAGPKVSLAKKIAQAEQASQAQEKYQSQNSAGKSALQSGDIQI